MMLLIIFGILLIVAGIGYFGADYIENWIPGWKHTITGLFTTITSCLAAIAVQVQGQEGAMATLLKRPEMAPVIAMFLGVIILVLGWVTKRAN